MHIDKCDQKNLDVTVDNVIYMPDNMDVVNEEGKENALKYCMFSTICIHTNEALLYMFAYVADITTKSENMQDIDVVALNLHNVKLDHDYTCLTLPDQASPAQDDDDEEDELSNCRSKL